MSNIKDGSKFEREFCELLSRKGFWAHRMAQNNAGQQPADIIAVFQGTAYLIDCKVCSNDLFSFSRMEANQRMAMDKWIACKGTMPKFALKDSKGQIWMLDYQWAVAKEACGDKGVPCARDRMFVVTFEEWMEWVV